MTITNDIYTLDAARDAALDYIADNGDEITLCETEPTSYTEAHATYKLGGTSLTVGSSSGADYTIANSTVNGRKLTLAAKSYISLTDSGVQTPSTAGVYSWFLCINDTDNEALIHKVTCTSTANLVSGNMFSVPSFRIVDIRDTATT